MFRSSLITDPVCSVGRAPPTSEDRERVTVAMRETIRQLCHQGPKLRRKVADGRIILRLRRKTGLNHATHVMAEAIGSVSKNEERSGAVRKKNLKSILQKYPKNIRNPKNNY